MDVTSHAVPARMARVAIVAPRGGLRGVLVALADAGCVDLGPARALSDGAVVEALRRLERAGAPAATPLVAATGVDIAMLEQAGRRDLLTGEAELAARAAGAAEHGSFAGLVGWAAQDQLATLGGALAAVGAAVVELPRPRFETPPTLLQPMRAARPFRPLVETFGAARYSDLDPTPFAAIAFVLMFGVMFGDAGHGLLLVLAGLVLRSGRIRRAANFRPLWPLPVACGAAAIVTGFAYGEAFGPTGLVPTLWRSPKDATVTLLVAAVALGVVLLAVGNVIGAVNRFRAAGLVAALVSPGGVAGLLLLCSGGLAAVALVRGGSAVVAGAIATGAVAVLLLVVGFARESGHGAAGVAEIAVQLIDALVRVAGNAVSFARLAAFGLMHAVIGAVVLTAARSVWGGPVGIGAACLIFVAGNALAFALEGLVTTVQALRLEYYELFSRVFAGEGRPFAPFALPVDRTLEQS
jgi:V/A-type H+/Na+-transporting ATPase subunit I